MINPVRAVELYIDEFFEKDLTTTPDTTRLNRLRDSLLAEAHYTASHKIAAQHLVLLYGLCPIDNSSSELIQLADGPLKKPTTKKAADTAATSLRICPSHSTCLKRMSDSPLSARMFAVETPVTLSTKKPSFVEKFFEALESIEIVLKKTSYESRIAICNSLCDDILTKPAIKKALNSIPENHLQLRRIQIIFELCIRLESFYDDLDDIDSHTVSTPLPANLNRLKKLCLKKMSEAFDPATIPESELVLAFTKKNLYSKELSSEILTALTKFTNSLVFHEGKELDIFIQQKLRQCFEVLKGLYPTDKKFPYDSLEDFIKLHMPNDFKTKIMNLLALFLSESGPEADRSDSSSGSDSDSVEEVLPIEACYTPLMEGLPPITQFFLQLTETSTFEALDLLFTNQIILQALKDIPNDALELRRLHIIDTLLSELEYSYEERESYPPENLTVLLDLISDRMAHVSTPSICPELPLLELNIISSLFNKEWIDKAKIWFPEFIESLKHHSDSEVFLIQKILLFTCFANLKRYRSPPTLKSVSFKQFIEEYKTTPFSELMFLLLEMCLPLPTKCPPVMETAKAPTEKPPTQVASNARTHAKEPRKHEWIFDLLRPIKIAFSEKNYDSASALTKRIIQSIDDCSSIGTPSDASKKCDSAKKSFFELLENQLIFIKDGFKTESDSSGYRDRLALMTLHRNHIYSYLFPKPVNRWESTDHASFKDGLIPYLDLFISIIDNPNNETSDESEEKPPQKRVRVSD